ncbi:anti-sigma factor [Desulfopila aestuarii]|uniref:Transmembrane transcriptional regulator (Anti-sigma factor RsiW) n=1 Tax=Desulfopila aestuarii DSM 18488 TaxID=1121416 RepID=A0A1M7Y603_9BACT|nr:hypothetical protein [Desulfopila aestuarii]SHO48095.1 hypothetical protein SAMN02745220_02124 [Desulfopila aestuarii DSM 18488]
MKRPDDKVLSQYLDGALDYQTTSVVADQLGNDRDSRDRLVRLAGVQARLRSMGREVIDEEVPARLLATLRGGRLGRSASLSSSVFRIFSMPLMRYAAVVTLVMFGFFSGRFSGDRSTPATAFFPSIPVELQYVVNRTLEFEPSGIAKTWQDQQLGMEAKVEPVRTFRSPAGDYYRMYILEIVEGNTVHPYVGIARRTGKQTWQTRSFHLQDGTAKI